jgi:hypothetical protein
MHPITSRLHRLLAPLRVLFAALLLSVTAGAAASSAAVAPFVGTHRAVLQGQDVLHLRVTADGAVEMVALGEGQRVAGRALMGTLTGRPGFTGLLASGEVFAIGPHDGRTVLTIGAQMFALTPLPAASYGVVPAATAPAPRAGGSSGVGGGATGSLAGLRLSMAKGGNGYFVERSFDFCGDGRVFKRVAESQLSQFGSGVTEHTDQGTWRIVNGALLLSLKRGGTQRVDVQRTEPTVFRLDGVGFIAERGRC